MIATLRLTEANRSNLMASDVPVVLSGPSGWLGSAALAMLDRAIVGDELRRRVLVFGSRDRDIRLPSGRTIVCRPMADMRHADLDDAVILHFAYLTKDKTRDLSPDEYVRDNDAIQDHILNGLARSRPRGLFFASSGAVYQPSEGGPTRENNLYGWMKAQHEATFARAAAASGAAIVNGRIFSVAGEFINKVGLYAMSDFLMALLSGRPIRLNATRPVWRSYTYVGDIINLALALLISRQSHDGLDIAGDEPVEVGHLARRCAEVTGRTAAEITRPPLTDAAPDRMIGDHRPYYDLMASYGITPLSLDEQIRATAQFLDPRHADPGARRDF